MSNIMESSSSQQRRKMMEKVKDMVASIEAKVRSKQEEIQDNDIPAESSEDEISGSKLPLDVDVHNSSLESRAYSNGEISYDDEEYDKVRDLETSIHVSDVSTSEDEIDALDTSQIYSSGSEESLVSLFGSPDEVPTDLKNKGEGVSDSVPVAPQSIPEDGPTHLNQNPKDEIEAKRSLMDDIEMETSSMRPADSIRHKAPPQDRSVASKISAVSSESKSSKISALSAATPFQPYTGQPIVSPPFSLISPPGRRAGARTTVSSDSKAYQKSTDINLSPKVKRFGRSAKSARKPLRNSSILKNMKSEIADLTAEFASLQEESRQRRAHFDLEPDDRFDESLNVMNRKADAMANALHRNMVRSDILQKDNDLLRETIRNWNKYTPKKDEHEHEIAKKKIHKSPKVLLKELDSSDEYVKRQYPPVPKTPGTMFATELVEVMGLEVGEHAYLAEVMDRQWNTSTSYRS